MNDPNDKFLVVDGRYIQRSTIAEILPSGDVLLLDGRIIGTSPARLTIIETQEKPK